MDHSVPACILTHTFLPSLLLVPAAPTACIDIVHSSIAASPASEAMVFSRTPCQSPSPLTPAPSLSHSAARCLSLLSFLYCVPGLRQK